jgi:hypothetical protein
MRELSSDRKTRQDENHKTRLMHVMYPQEVHTKQVYSVARDHEIVEQDAFL